MMKPYIFFYDTPYLLKCTRNTFTKYNIEFGNGTANWHHIIDIYAKNKMQAIRIAPKLTDSHINLNSFEKMRVNYDARFLAGHTYATLGGLPREAEATAEFINIMNELFDVFNSSTKHLYRSRKYAIAKNNDNIEFLKKAR